MLSILSCQKIFFTTNRMFYSPERLFQCKSFKSKKNSPVTAQNEKLNLHKSTANGKTHFPKLSLALAK